jgi:putative membrane protein
MENMNRTDQLALERSLLANERTFLAYFRTFIVLLSSGIAVIKLDLLKDILLLGYFLIIISPLLLMIGIHRYRVTKKRLFKISSVQPDNG